LRPLQPSQAAALLELRLRNRRYFQPSEQLRDDEWFTLERQRRQLEVEARDRAPGRSLTAASQRVLANVGFRREGLAERYLLLAGRWTDQELWAITVEDELGPGAP
jgi:RimJ/RimL family protein N-acetyltransferase